MTARKIIECKEELSKEREEEEKESKEAYLYEQENEDLLAQIE